MPPNFRIFFLLLVFNSAICDGIKLMLFSLFGTGQNDLKTKMFEIKLASETKYKKYE